MIVRVQTADDDVIVAACRERGLITPAEVAAIDPVASMEAIDNPALLEAARKVREKLAKVMDASTGTHLFQER